MKIILGLIMLLMLLGVSLMIVGAGGMLFLDFWKMLSDYRQRQKKEER